jgi:hypothetical protein
MLKPEPSASRGELRVWLKTALRSGVFDRVPSDYARPGSCAVVAPKDYADDLLAELQTFDPDSRQLAEILQDIREFRRWVAPAGICDPVLRPRSDVGPRARRMICRAFDPSICMKRHGKFDEIWDPAHCH